MQGVSYPVVRRYVADRKPKINPRWVTASAVLRTRMVTGQRVWVFTVRVCGLVWRNTQFNNDAADNSDRAEGRPDDDRTPRHWTWPDR
jgi:hypothetical protein